MREYQGDTHKLDLSDLSDFVQGCETGEEVRIYGSVYKIKTVLRPNPLNPHGPLTRINVMGGEQAIEGA